MIDLHAHILPGLDDGAESWDDAIEMARRARDSGVVAIAATSHVHPLDPQLDQYIEVYHQRFQKLKQKLKEESIAIDLYTGMEILVVDGVMEVLRDKKIPTLNQGSYILVEFLFQEKLEIMEQALKEMIAIGYYPLLAHPERYRMIRHHLEKLYEWHRMGVVFQVNKGSLLGDFGSKIQNVANFMLSEGLVGVVASDAHDTYNRTTRMDDIQDELEYRCGIHGAQLLLKINPDKICNSKPLF